MTRIIFSLSRSTMVSFGAWAITRWSEWDWWIIGAAIVFGIGSFMMGLDGPDRKP